MGDHLTDVPCVALGRPTCGRADVPCVGDVPCLCVADVRWGAQLADVPCVALGRPTCGRALCCVGAAKLRTFRVLRLGAHLADAPCIGLGRPTLVRPYQKVYLQAKICSYPSSSSSFSLVLPCVDVFVADEFCVWATILRTCLALRWGAQIADVRTSLALQTCLAFAYAFADVSCLAFALRTCLAFELRTCVADVLWGAQLADVPCVALGRPTLVRPY